MVRGYSDDLESISSKENQEGEMIWGVSDRVKSNIENIKKYDADWTAPTKV